MKFEILKQEVATRKKTKDEIRKCIDDYCMQKFGIENFFSIADKHFNQPENLQICLVRQIPTPNVEHLAVYLAANNWGFEPTYISFVRDSFPQQAKKNEYKKSLISTQQVFRGRKGSLIVQSERLSQEKMLQNIILADIVSSCKKKTLPEVHWELMEKAILNPPQKMDLSKFFRELLLKSSKNLPDRVFIRQGRYEKPARSNCGTMSDPRPPATWYYFFYLLLFLDGNRALASTMDKDPKVLAWFQENNQKIEEICGFSPLILDTPLEVEVEGFKSKLNEIPRKALGGNGFLPSIPRPNDEVGFFELMKHFEEQLLAHA